MMRIRVNLETISTLGSQSTQDQRVIQEKLQTSLVRHHEDLTESLNHAYERVGQRIGKVEELLKAQTVQLQANQFTQMGPFYGHTSPTRNLCLVLPAVRHNIPTLQTRKT